MKLASFDLEISDELDLTGETVPHISCAKIALSEQNTTATFQSPEGQPDMTVEQVDEMVTYMITLIGAGYRLLTWNGVSFDFQVLAHWAGADLTPAIHEMAWKFHTDMMLLCTFQSGHRLSLDAALKGSGLETKLHNVVLNSGAEITDMSGAKAPELWRAGERQAVLDYLEVDVRQPLKLAELINKQQGFYWMSKKGRRNWCRTTLMTVKDAYSHLPEPGDTSWLTDPINRREYIAKYLPEFAE